MHLVSQGRYRWLTAKASSLQERSRVLRWRAGETQSFLAPFQTEKAEQIREAVQIAWTGIHAEDFDNHWH